MKSSLQSLFIKYLNDQCSNAEILELMGHFRLEEDVNLLKSIILAELDQDISVDMNQPAAGDPDIEQRLDRIKGRLQAHIYQSSTPVKRTLWLRIGIAAAVLLLVASGLWFTNGYLSDDTTAEIRYANDVVPGKTGATLTLANGRQVQLGAAADGELADEPGVRIAKTAEGQLVYEITGDATAQGTNTLSTGKGETYQLKLPDGSRVWLNAASGLTYTTSLYDQGLRKVKLSGEAYFEIEKDPAHPFIVESEGQQVEVLGTHFNVKAYKEEAQVRTTLLEGSVRLNALSAENQKAAALPAAVLKPGEEAVNNGTVKIEKADLEEAVAWKNGNIVFRDKTLEDIMLELSRWYNVTVVYAPDAPRKVSFSGAVSRARNLSAVLERMQTTGSVRFSIEGHTVTVMK